MSFEVFLRSSVKGTPTILVSVNYLMGPLGFPRGDDVTREAETGSPILNLGSRDNVAALQWIKEHISAFGGDPDKVLYKPLYKSDFS